MSGAFDFDVDAGDPASTSPTFAMYDHLHSNRQERIENLETPEKPRSIGSRTLLRTGVAYIGSAGVGAFYGLGVGIKAAQPLPSFRIKRYVILNNVFKSASKTGNVCGALGLMYTFNEYILDKFIRPRVKRATSRNSAFGGFIRNNGNEFYGVCTGVASGMMFKSMAGWRVALVSGGLMGGAVATAFFLYQQSGMDLERGFDKVCGPWRHYYRS